MKNIDNCSDRKGFFARLMKKIDKILLDKSTKEKSCCTVQSNDKKGSGCCKKA